MIAWSESQLNVRVVQPRRMACTHCRTPFVYLATDEFEKTVRGLPYVSLVTGEVGRKQRLLEAVEEELESRSLRGKGAATCPHCRYQLAWMEATRPATVILYTIGGFIGGAVVAWLLGMVLGWSDLIVIVSGAALGAILLSIFGFRADLTPRPLPESADKDLRSMSDEGWTVLAETSAQRGLDPAEAWWHVVLEKRPPKEGEAVIGMPLADETSTRPEQWPADAAATRERRPLTMRKLGNPARARSLSSPGTVERAVAEALTLSRESGTTLEMAAIRHFGACGDTFTLAELDALAELGRAAMPGWMHAVPQLDPDDYGQQAVIGFASTTQSAGIRLAKAEAADLPPLRPEEMTVKRVRDELEALRERAPSAAELRVAIVESARLRDSPADAR